MVVRTKVCPVFRRLERAGDAMAAADDTYGVGFVYAYCGFDDFRALARSLFGPARELPEKEAEAYCSFGASVASKFANVAVVWISNAYPKMETIHSAMHEISHVADCVMEHAGVSDKSGESRAYLIGREAARVLEGLYGLKCARPVTDGVLRGMLQ